MKVLQATRNNLEQAVNELVRQKDQLLMKLIGYTPSAEDAQKLGSSTTDKEGNTTIYWDGKPLVTFSPCQWISVKDEQGEKIKAKIEYNIPDESTN